MKHDILRFNTDFTELKIHGNKIIGLRSNKLQKSAARVFKNGQIYSSAFIGSISDADLLNQAERAGNVGLGYDYDLPSTAALESFHEAPFSRDEGLQKFTQFFQELKKEFPNLNWSGTGQIQTATTKFSSDYTGTLQTGGEAIQWHLLYKKFGSTDFADGVLFFQGTHLDFSGVLDSYRPLLESLDNTVAIESKKMPVLMLEAWDLTSRLAMDLRPERLRSGASYLSGKVGKKIFNSQLTLQDISFHPTKGKFSRFDGEGVLHHNPRIVEEGVFTNVLYDLREAHKASAKSSGNGQRDFNTGASFGVFDLNITSGKEDVWELIKDIPECLVVSMAYGGGISEQWEYSSPVQVGFLFRHGKPVGRVPGVSLKGSLTQFLGDDLIGISKEGLGGASMPALLTQLEVIAH